MAGKCIVVDDSQTIRMLLVKIMENFGFNVIEAESGEEALELCRRENPNLIISDWRLPLMDGIDVLYKIRGDRRLSQPKFMFCATMSDIDNIRMALDGGADDFIMRPFDEEIIGSKLAILGLL